jgi:Protein of unknown function (DUF2842)
MPWARIAMLSCKDMRQRQRKFIGTVILIVFLAAYALLAMGVAAIVLPKASRLAEFLFYLVSGLVWVIPAGALVWWMQRPDSAPEA